MLPVRFRGFVSSAGEAICELLAEDDSILDRRPLNPSYYQVRQVEQALKQGRTLAQTLAILLGPSTPA